MSKVLPPFYYYYFWIFESVLTIAGGISAIVDPIKWTANLMPSYLERSTLNMGHTSRGQTITGQLGSCFLLLGMISVSLFYLFKKHLNDQPVIQEKLVRGLLIPLAIADPSLGFLCSTGMTLLPLPVSHLKNPSEWTFMLHATVWITLGLFIVRIAWLFGIGRASTQIKRSTVSSIHRARLPLSKANSEAVVEQITRTEPSPAQKTPTSTRKRAGRARKIVDDD
nr:hypothetical protein L204_00706 [Cryptococcus depauperatus CBS 7855]